MSEDLYVPSLFPLRGAIWIHEYSYIRGQDLQTPHYANYWAVIKCVVPGGIYKKDDRLEFHRDTVEKLIRRRVATD